MTGTDPNVERQRELTMLQAAGELARSGRFDHAAIVAALEKAGFPEAPVFLAKPHLQDGLVRIIEGAKSRTGHGDGENG